MSQNERLREALLEIEVLRDREQRSLRETQALLDILKVTTAGQDPLQSLRTALDLCVQVIEADVVFVGALTETGLRVEAATAPDLEGKSVPVPASYFLKPRTVLDTGTVPDLSSFRDHFPHQSLVTAPDRTDQTKPLVLIGLGTDAQQFSKDHLNFLERVTQLTSHATRNLALAAQNALLAAVIGGSSSSFAIADARDDALPLIFVNKAFEDLTGYRADDVLGRNCRVLSAEAKDSPERARLRAAVKDRRGGRFLLQNKRADGTLFWNELTLFPVRRADGEVTQLVATQTDASERVRAERDARKARERLQSVLDHTRDAFVMLQKDGTIAFANDATRAMFPASGVDWRVGSTFDANWAAYLNGLPKSFTPVADVLQTPDLLDLAGHRDGQRTNLPDGRQVLVRAERAEGDALVLSATDTTSIRNTERLLKQRAAAVDHAIDGIAILDDAGRIVYANGALATLLGHGDASEVLGRKWDGFYQEPETEDPFRGDASLSDTARILQRKQGRGAATLHEVSLFGVAKVGDVLIARDVTAAVRNRHRLAEMDKQIEDARRREVISDLAAGLAHDFNNVLSAISGSATLIQSEPETSDAVRQHADRISKAGVSAARLVNRMLDLGQVDEAASVFDLRSILGELRALAEVHMSSETTFTIDAGREALQVYANGSDIALAVLNLAINAADALPDGRGEVRIAVSRQRPFADREPLLGRPVSKPYGCISVRDTGTGIAADVMPNILKAFYTTKGSRGTGAGLAMVAAIVKRLDGLIYVDSAETQGTVFDLMFPLIDDDVGVFEAPTTDLRGKAILILDDQPDVAEVTASYLETCGAEVSILTDPHLAVETVLEDPEDWAALITDYDMPQMSGGDVVEAIRAKAPDIPIFVVTALARRLSDRRITDQTVRAVFAKPTDLGQLAQALAALDDDR